MESIRRTYSRIRPLLVVHGLGQTRQSQATDPISVPHLNVQKGSVPLMTVKAHDAKIYGVSWSRIRPNELLSCSLDSTVKVWDVSAAVEHYTSGLSANTVPSLASDSYDIRPSRVARTRYPVSRARAVPFGDGFLTMPQRGENVLELWSHQHGLHEPVHTFYGLGDIAKEFVWRTRTSAASSMREWPRLSENTTNLLEAEGSVQLVTWGKDHALRFIPVEANLTEASRIAVVCASNPNTAHRNWALHPPASPFQTPTYLHPTLPTRAPIFSAPSSNRRCPSPPTSTRSSTPSASAASPKSLLPSCCPSTSRLRHLPLRMPNRVC